jgi:catechol 2,3-dioxygenase-like lactoylglutathione lyase family enzyme
MRAAKLVPTTETGWAALAGADHVLDKASVATRLTAHDLERARAFYARALGLEPVEERPGGLLYRCGNGEFALFETDGTASGIHTQLAWEVEDVEVAVRQLRARGVTFEEYDVPGLRTIGGIAKVEGNYQPARDRPTAPPRPMNSAASGRRSFCARAAVLAGRILGAVAMTLVGALNEHGGMACLP